MTVSGGTEYTGTAPINVADNVISIAAATTSAAGSMSAADKAKLDGIADGANNYDGGALSGDSMLRSLKSQIQNMMTGITNRSGDLDIYSVGIEFDSDGQMSLDTTKFKENIKDNFNAVVNLFSGEDNDPDNVTEKDGVLLRLDSIIETYTKSNGVLDERSESLNAEIRDYEAQESENAAYLEQYEENLRQRYAKLDTTIANFNNSLNYLYSALS